MIPAIRQGRGKGQAHDRHKVSVHRRLAGHFAALGGGGVRQEAQGMSRADRNPSDADRPRVLWERRPFTILFWQIYVMGALVLGLSACFWRPGEANRWADWGVVAGIVMLMITPLNQLRARNIVTMVGPAFESGFFLGNTTNRNVIAFERISEISIRRTFPEMLFGSVTVDFVDRDSGKTKVTMRGVAEPSELVALVKESMQTDGVAGAARNEKETP